MTTTRTNDRLKQALFAEAEAGKSEAMTTSTFASTPGEDSERTADLLKQLGKTVKERKVPLVAHIEPRLDEELRRLASASGLSLSEVTNRLLAKALGCR